MKNRKNSRTAGRCGAHRGAWAGLWAVDLGRSRGGEFLRRRCSGVLPTGAVSVICYENEGGEIALEYLDDT